MDIEVGLCLSPEGFLFLNSAPSDLPDFKQLEAYFAESSARGLLFLGLLNFSIPLPTTVLFWQAFSKQFITAVCKVTNRDSSTIDTIPHPPQEELRTLVMQAPCMQGGEYLSQELLVSLWTQLEKALQAELKNFTGSVQDYLGQYNPRWNLVGRICFHLAENKNNPHHPFAFLATYTTRLSSNSSPQHIPLKRALCASAAEKNALLALLTPVQKAAELSPFIRNLVDSGNIFEAAAWGVKEAHQFLKDVPLMEASGVIVRIPNWWIPRKPPRVKADIQIGGQSPSTLGLGSLLSFNVQLAVGNESLTEEEWADLQHSNDPLVKIRGQWVEIDRDKLATVLSHWNELKAAAREGLSISETLRYLSGIDQPDTPVAEWSDVKAGAWLKTVLEQLQNPQKLQSADLSQLQGTLRPYQSKGVQWLWTLYQLKLGGCLADDMGLGKTIQVLSLLLAIKKPNSSHKPHLLIVPASLLGNWQAEIARFAPSLKISVAHSSEKNCDLLSADLVLTTYGFVQRWERLKETEWDLLILDEAQAIKNPSSKQTQVIKTLKSQVRLALTGTPVENRLGDLWSLFDFIAPGLLGSEKEFSSYAKPADKEHFMTSLRKLTRPYILRRLKSDKTIISDLPDKTEIKTYCSLSRQQIHLYQATIANLSKQLETSEGIQRRGIILSSLMRLKQICNHPAQVLGYGEYNEEASGKMARLREICETIVEKQERVLIFTQFTEIIPALFSYLTQIFKKEGLMLHGGTPVARRGQLVEAFQRPNGPPFFILSLKAGGTGLNLTKASHVIHFDRWWNPAVENQATDRAYRIGQKKTVLVHQFICPGTVEEKIDMLIETKKNLSQQLLKDDGEVSLTELSNQQVIQMVSLDIHRVLKED